MIWPPVYGQDWNSTRIWRNSGSQTGSTLGLSQPVSGEQIRGEWRLVNRTAVTVPHAHSRVGSMPVVYVVTLRLFLLENPPIFGGIEKRRYPNIADLCGLP